MKIIIEWEDWGGTTPKKLDQTQMYISRLQWIYVLRKEMVNL